MQVTASHERPETTTHAEFVQGYRGGRIALTWADGLPAYTFAAWGRWFIGYLQLLVGLRSVFVLFVILTFVLRDPLLLLGIPAAYLGTAAGAPGHDARKSLARVFMTAAAFLGLVFGLFLGRRRRHVVVVRRLLDGLRLLRGWGARILMIFERAFARRTVAHAITPGTGAGGSRRHCRRSAHRGRPRH